LNGQAPEPDKSADSQGLMLHEFQAMSGGANGNQSYFLIFCAQIFVWNIAIFTE
tara:strand:+ start:895 stop:1056 length:162 start_codon:yes stop_codon:yes gene_type:complete